MPDFKTIHTNHGLQLMAQAEASGTPINLTHMAVGDGNGNPVTPSEEQATLVRERFRATINRVYQDPERANKYTAEMIIPASTGGFTLREIGIFDSNGSLFAVGNLPETYKPTTTDGAFADAVIRFEFLVANATEVTLLVDPNTAVATQQWIINNVTMCTLTPGGTTGQVLRKASNGCGDVEWADPDNINVTVNTIDEEQTLADAQTIVDLAVVTTRGLAVYVDGVRLYQGAGADRWQKAEAPNDLTRIVLGSSYPAGTKLIAAQNEPTGNAPAPLERSKNLSDLESVPAARTALDVYSKAETDQKAPPGAVIHFARSAAPTGWLKANGAAVSRTAYAGLFAAIGTTFGAGDGFNTFNLPDLRGEFLRGWDDGRGVDAGRGFGTLQGDDLKSHTHSGSTSSNGSHTHSVTEGTLQGGGTSFTSGDDFTDRANTYSQTGAAGQHTHSLNINATGGTETRPRNRALLACIKY